jgi:tetratricopeptide (TPR) repeat protein
LRFDLQISRSFAGQLFCLAEEARDPHQVLEAHRAMGVAWCESSLLVSARAHLEQGVALYKVQQHRGHRELYAQDPGMVCHSYLALVLWLLGYPTQAQQHSQRALRLANDLGDPYNLSNAFWYAMFLQQFCRNVRATEAQAEATIKLATRMWALTRQGGGSAQMVQQQHQDTMAYVATGANVPLYYLALLAESYGHIGQLDNGLQVLSKTLTMEQPWTEVWWEAELYRLRGELLLQSHAYSRHTTYSQLSVDEAEACFHHALAIASRQQAKSLELRAAMSLAGLWSQQGKAREARQILADTYGWFTEGFETADLQDAAAFLDKFA